MGRLKNIILSAETIVTGNGVGLHPGMLDVRCKNSLFRCLTRHTCFGAGLALSSVAHLPYLITLGKKQIIVFLLQEASVEPVVSLLRRSGGEWAQPAVPPVRSSGSTARTSVTSVKDPAVLLEGPLIQKDRRKDNVDTIMAAIG